MESTEESDDPNSRRAREFRYEAQLPYSYSSENSNSSDLSMDLDDRTDETQIPSPYLSEDDNYNKASMDLDDEDSLMLHQPEEELYIWDEDESQRLIRKGRECLEREKEEQEIWEEEERVRKENERLEREERQHEIYEEENDSMSLDLDLDPETFLKQFDDDDDSSPLSSPRFLSTQLYHLRASTDFPIMSIPDNLYIDASMMSEKYQLTSEDWRDIQMRVEVIPSKGKQEHDKGRTVLLFCTIPRKEIIDACVVGISLFAAQACIEIFQKESSYITHQITELSRSLTSLPIPNLDYIFENWWYTHEEGQKELIKFNGRRPDDTKFVAYILGEGNITNKVNAKQMSNLIVLNKTG